MVTPEQKSETVNFVVAQHAVSVAQACKLIGCSRSKYYYTKKMPAKDEEIKQLIAANLKYNDGRNKVIVKIRKRRKDVSVSRIRRVYQQQGFSLYKRMTKQRIKRKANPITLPLSSNVEWACDFMSDALITGRRFRTINAIDHYSRKCYGILCAYSITSGVLVNWLNQLITRYGKPKYIRTDNGPEFISKRFQKWLHDNEIGWQAIEPGKPQQNCIIERFNKSYRCAILDASLFKTIQHAQQQTDQWLDYYNEERPHEALQNQTPNNYAA